jgi:hypothetical protein
MGKSMKISPQSELDQDYEPFFKLLQVMRDDPVINEKVLTILKLDPYQRRSIINNWLEQLRKQNALEGLQQALTCLFDDNVASKVLKIISTHQYK